LSQDEIVFDEVRYREPERLCRPDRDRSIACMAYELPGPDELPIFLDGGTADAIERHALRDTSVELGGILLGKECLDDQTGLPFVWVTESLEAKHYENTQASFTYTHDSWEEITRQRDALHPELDIVGWYHTHPDFGIFLSGHDLFIHRNFFAQPLQVAYVVDPIRQTRGFFQWRDGGVAQVGGYFVTAPRDGRIALARLVNDLENIPNPNPQDGGGGRLSPRLEAELIAMLTRPTAPQTTTAERTMLALLFGLVGTLVGVLGVLGVLWLSQLARGLQDQRDQLATVARSVDRSSAAQRLALEALLATSRSAERDPDAFVTQYNRTVNTLDETRRRLELQETARDELAASVRALEKKNVELTKDLGDATTLAQSYEKDAKETLELRHRVTDLAAKAEDQALRLAEQGEVIDTIEGRRARDLIRRYDRAWYTAAAGWGVALLLALGLVAAFGLKPADLSEPEHGHGSEPDARPGTIGGGYPPASSGGEEPPAHHIT
jgi:proteasome lid subunit RPN8/RPN11